MYELGKIVPRLLLGAGDSEESRREAVFAAWGVASGELLRSRTAPIRFENKTLVVAATGESWRTQLKQVSRQLLFKINSALGASIVRSLVFVLNEEAVTEFHQRPTSSVTFSAPEDQARQFEGRIAPIKDPRLRERFLRAAGKCLDRRAR